MSAPSVARTTGLVAWRAAGVLAWCTGFWVLVAMVANVHYRPLDGVEGEMLFEASRIRSGLALYTDPLQGALDYGTYPSRFWVLYLPFFPSLLALAPLKTAVYWARLANLLAYLGLICLIVRQYGVRRMSSVLAMASALIGGYWITLYATSGRPDGVAVTIAGFALLRCVRQGRVDPLVAALFAIAALIKPNVVGLGAGALLMDMGVQRIHAWRNVATVVGVILLAAIGTVVWGGHLGWEHLKLSTLQPFSVALWKQRIAWTLPFHAPFVCAGGLCAWRAYRTRRAAADGLLLAAIGASTLFCCVSLGKTGSAANYWIEPCLGAFMALCIHAESLRAWAQEQPAVPVLGMMWLLYQAGYALPHAWSDLRNNPRVYSELQKIRAALPAGQVVLAREPGLELMINSRVLSTPFQFTHAVRAGHFPLHTWVSDIERQEVAGILVWERDLVVQARDDSVFPPAVVQTMLRNFCPVWRADPYVYLARCSQRQRSKP